MRGLRNSNVDVITSAANSRRVDLLYTGSSDRNIDALRQMIKEDNLITYAQILASLGTGVSATQKIFHVQLVVRKPNKEEASRCGNPTSRKCIHLLRLSLPVEEMAQDHSLVHTVTKLEDNRQGLELNGLHQLLVYANDVNMLGENPQTIRENTEILLEASKAIGLEVNPEKTKYMIKSCDQNIVRYGTIKVGNLFFEEVEKSKYLGATVTNINEIKRRINMGNACYYSVEKLLSSSLLSKNLKV
ncbi:hypothetical protein ANN_02119 [Periplaneta americana]|uniref:Reverse transcriptase domain-containing protein n=1 Tax=Periplaneta americana TaxID=6978 RepID=A0ABQ8TZK5_PERAM|nr:hypothetical protein ANN_02119 [Periplaneta americana]